GSYMQFGLSCSPGQYFDGVITAALRRRRARQISERVLSANVLGNAFADRNNLAQLVRYESLASGCQCQLPEDCGILVGIVGVEDSDRVHLNVGFVAGLQHIGKSM